MPPRDDPRPATESTDGAKTDLVDTVRAVGGDELRDIWVLDQAAQEALYLREDVAETIEDIDVERYLDNERFGFVTRDTYNELHYSDFGYTVRGFDTWELFRTFLVRSDVKVGVLCSLDRRDGGYDYSQLNDAIQSLLDDHDASAFAPARD